MNTWNDIENQKREAELREAYSAIGGAGGGGGPYYAELNSALHESRIAEPVPVDPPCYGKTRRQQLLDAYAARREELTDADRSYLLEQREPDLADLIATHSIHIAPYDAIVYARIDKREVGVKYSATGGDKAKAVRLAVREVLRLVGVTA